MIKKIFKATIALLLAVNVVAGVGADTVKAGAYYDNNGRYYEYGSTGEFVRVFYNGEELYMPIYDNTYKDIYYNGDKDDIEAYKQLTYEEADYGILENGRGLFHYNSWAQIHANQDDAISFGESAYVYGVDPTTHKIMDGAVIYSADMSAAWDFKGENRYMRPNANLDKYETREVPVFHDENGYPFE